MANGMAHAQKYILDMTLHAKIYFGHVLRCENLFLGDALIRIAGSTI
jgi:hypothetical protein